MQLLLLMKMLITLDNNFFHNKNALLAFSDPAGAKSVLAYAAENYSIFRSIVAVSNRSHDFYGDFDISVEEYSDNSAEQWLAKANANILITGTSYPIGIEIELISAARQACIPAFTFVDHWVNMAKRFETAASLVLPDVVCVIDERARQYAINDGIPENRILVSGNPYHVFLRQWKSSRSRNHFLAELGLPPQGRYILYAPEPLSVFGLDVIYGFNELEAFELLYCAAEPLLGCEDYIVIKAHPNQRHALFTEHLRTQSHDNVIYIEGGNLPDFLYHADCVLGLFSNSLIEASILGKDVIRPLMKLSKQALDPLVMMESPDFRSFYDLEAFADAISDMLLKRRLR